MKIKIYLAIFLTTIATAFISLKSPDYSVTSSKPAVSSSQEGTWKLMIGKWYGKQPTKDGGTKEEIIEKLPNGTYKIQFRVTQPDGTKTERTEVGYWGVSGNIYFSIFKGWLSGSEIISANPTDPYNYDAYHIIELTTEKFEYQHVSTGNRYVNQRVGNDFKFQEI